MKNIKFISHPVKPWKINQLFNENRSCIDLATNSKVITCDGHNPPAGYKSVYSQIKGHQGLDLRAKRGQAVHSVQDGVVVEVVSEEARGVGIGIITDRKFYCTETGKDEYFKMRYWHHLVNLRKLGDKVFIGDVIALADNTGYSSGDHLHFEMKPVKYLKNGGYVNVLQSNGYFGAVDPLPYMQDRFAGEFMGLKTLAQRLKFIISLIK